MSDLAEVKEYPRTDSQQAPRLARLVRMHRYVQKHQGTPNTKQVRFIANKLGMTERTAYRELALLRRLYLCLRSSKLD